MYLDDIRDPPAPYWRIFRCPISFLEELKNTLPKCVCISLDHDLGENIPTGYDVITEMERMIFMKEWMPEFLSLQVHSANPVGRIRIE